MDDHHQDNSWRPASSPVGNCALPGSMLTFELHSGTDDIQKLEVRDSKRRKVYHDMVGYRSPMPGLHLDKLCFG